MPKAPSILAGTICRAEQVKMTRNSFQLSEYNPIFSEIAHCKNLKLKTLILYGGNIKGVDPKTLSSAITRLKEVSLSEAFLSTNQLNILLKDISCSRNSYLRILELYGEDLSEVLSDVFAKGVCRLLEINLSEQFDALFAE